tara:strand:+ start:1994 stop:2800 length:807 start_codon:yes stop_codon:yes gene_type:complete
MDKKLIITIPHYNNPEGLIQSIKSINESFKIDIIITDDGSKIKLDEKLIRSVFKNEGNIYFEYLNNNYGVGIAANKCLEFVKNHNYNYAARLDAGDICYKNKFLKQINFLKKNNKIKLVGTWARALDDNKILKFFIKHPTEHNIIKRKMYLNCMFVNPTVVFDTSILKTIPEYPIKYKDAAQDYAFFFNVIKNYECANLPEVLLDYVINDSSISSQKRKLQVKNRIKIILDNFKPGFYPLYGLIRNFILYFFSRKATTMLKRISSREE